jgi:FkbM family methyltransferase
MFIVKDNIILYMKRLWLHKIWRPILKIINKIEWVTWFIRIMWFIWYIDFLRNQKKTNDSEIFKFKINNYNNFLYMRKGTSDIEVFKQVFIDKQFNQCYCEKTSPKLIINCGAYVWYSSIYFAIKYPKAKIIAVEPELWNYNMLQKNTTAIHTIEIINKWVRRETTDLVVTNHWRDRSFRLDEINKNGQVINTITIIELMQSAWEKTIDILKIDIEWAEEKLFLNNSKQRLKSTRVIIMELHERFVPGSTKKINDIADKYFKYKKNVSENIVFSWNYNL